MAGSYVPRKDMLGFHERAGNNPDKFRTAGSFSATTAGLMSSFTANDMLSKQFDTDYTNDDGDNQLKTMVTFQIPAKVPENAESFAISEKEPIFLFNPQKVIKNSRTDAYPTYSLAGANCQIVTYQTMGYDKLRNMVLSLLNTRSKRSLVSGEMSPEEKYFMSKQQLERLLHFTGFVMSDVTAKHGFSLSISKTSKGFLFAVQHAGRGYVANMFEANVCPGLHLHFALVKLNNINPENPFERRYHRIVPVTSTTSTGKGTYFRYGVCRYDNESPESKSVRKAKRTRINMLNAMPKRSTRLGVSHGTVDIYTDLPPEFYYPNSTICNAEAMNRRSVTGTVCSLMRHEGLNCFTRDRASAKRICGTYLDWTTTSFDPDQVLTPATTSRRTNAAFKSRFYSMVRQSALHWLIGLVTSPNLGPPKCGEIVDAAVFGDNMFKGKQPYLDVLQTGKIAVEIRTRN